MIFKSVKTGDLSVKFLEKYMIYIVLLFIGLVYMRYLPVSYDFDGTVFSQHLRYALVKGDIIRALHPHHLLYFPCNYLLYKALHLLLGYQVLEYFHLQLFSLVFGLLTLGLVYKMLKQVTGKLFYSVVGTILMAFTWGFWCYSVEAEVHMAGLFFMVWGIYRLFFKPESTKNLILSALGFALGAGFHLTNGLIVFSVLSVFIYRKKPFKSLVKFLAAYFTFLAVAYLLYYLAAGVNILGLFKNVVSGGKDYFAGYEIKYWKPPSLVTLFESLQTIGRSIIGASAPLFSVLSLVVLISMAAVIIITARGEKTSAREEKARPLYFEMFSWMLPYLLFFSVWTHTGIEFKLNILLPLVILFIYSLSRYRQTVIKFIILILAVGVMVINFYFVILPANDPGNNKSYQLAEAIKSKTDDDAVIIIAGCGSEISLYSKIYLPYFAYRKVMILDWMVGKGFSLEDLELTIRESSKSQPVYFLSELTYMSEAVTCFLRNHQLDSGGYLQWVSRLKLGPKILLRDDYFLYKINP